MDINARMTWLAGGVFAVMMAASPAMADETGEVDGAEEVKIETLSPDLGYGDHGLAAEDRFGQPLRVRGRVDQRGELNPLAGRSIGWTTGYIPPAGTFTYSQNVLLGQRVAFSVRDGLEVSGHYFLPVANQTYAGGGAQLRVLEGDAWTLTTGVKGRYRRTNFEPGTMDAGVGFHAVLDVIASDDTTWNLGASAHVPIYLMVEEVDFSECDTRREWAEGACGTTASRSGFMPLSGHWVSLFAGVNHFVTDWLIVNVEAFSGASQGNFWALESALDRELNYSTELELVENTDWSGGLGIPTEQALEDSWIRVIGKGCCRKTSIDIVAITQLVPGRPDLGGIETIDEPNTKHLRNQLLFIHGPIVGITQPVVYFLA